ncbi:hypothetical protein MKZ38_005111 [Zalerion maritima]|uniref:Smr domain-containing protein n=1 Tax=Zalerion maritima TaxID=339359 RepID=A0AAD5RRD2_9PEZI|nr:hypothetical protein MKZ38_005111 [Zalerion maritima]
MMPSALLRTLGYRQRDSFPLESEDEFCTTLEESLIIPILNDFDLTKSDDEAQARQTLQVLADAAALEQAAGLDEATLEPDKGDSQSDESPDATDTPATTISSATNGANPDGLQPFAAVHAFDSLSEDEKVDQLHAIFGDLKLHDVKLTIKKVNGDVTSAIEELLTIQYLESTGQRQKGIDGFFVEDESPQRKKRKGKGKGRSKKLAGSVAQSSSSQYPSSSTNWTASGSSETDGSSDVSPQTPAELDSKGQDDVIFVAVRLNLVEDEVAKVYLASNCSLPETIENFIQAFLGIGLESTHQSLSSRVEHLKSKYPAVPHEYLPCITDMTEKQADANDIAGILQGYYAKPGRKKLYVDYSLKPVILEAEDTTPKARSSTSMAAHVHRPVQPALAKRPLSTPSASSTSSTPSAAPRNPNQWSVVQRKRGNSNRSSQPTTPSGPAFSSQTVTPWKNPALCAATDAYRKGTSNPLWKQAAMVHYERGVEIRQLATAADADRIAATSHTENSIDLHGLRVAEAVRIAKRAAEEWWTGLNSHQGIETRGKTRLARDLGGFRIITGRGIHSEGGRSKLRPAVLAVLLQDGWNVQSSTGAFVVNGKR